MAHPFTPQETFSDNTVPKVTAEFLNRDQAGLNAAARPVYMRKPVIQATCNDGTNLYSGPGIPAFMVLDSVTSEYVSVEVASGYVALSSSNLVPAGSFANSTWYYVYGYAASGVIGYEISATAPESGNLLYQDGDETRRYLCCFRTDNAGAIVPFRCLNGRYLFDVAMSVSLSGSFNAVGTSSFQTWGLTSYDFGGSILPPHSTWAMIQMFGNLAVEVYFRPTSTSYGNGPGVPTARFAKMTATGDVRFEMGTSTGQSIDVSVQGASTYFINVDGFAERGA